MKDEFALELKDAKILNEFRLAVLKILTRWQKKGHTRIGFVAGPVTANTLEQVACNLNRLALTARFLEAQWNFPIYSAGDVFTPEWLDQNRAMYVNQDFIDFWRAIHGSGQITDMFISPKWRKSVGTIDEHKLAKLMDINVYYLMQTPL